MSDVPPAVAATAQTQVPPVADDSPKGVRGPGLGERFLVGTGVTRTASCRPYERRDGDPLYRPLKIFTMDPASERRDGSVAVVNVPYETLKPGPVGAVFRVFDFDGTYVYEPVNLDDPKVLLNDGVEPSASRSSPEFHQQMVYAVASAVYAVFRMALGRHVSWGFPSKEIDDAHRLVLRPHATHEQNACYDKEAGEIQFGYFKAPDTVFGLNLPGGSIFTCLSHDIVVHEVTHALLDGVRAHFEHPLGPDVLALHEGLADIVAIFQRFTYRSVVEAALRQSHGNVEGADLLTQIGRQFGHTTGNNKAMRSVVESVDKLGNPLQHDSSLEPHQRGSVLAAAIFEAFANVFGRRTERYVRLATEGSGILPPGDLSPYLVSVLADEATKVAGHFLSICIRAVDYCPPVDVTFGDYLRALITADRALVPDDTWGYREAMIAAFSKRKIYPLDVDSLSEDALIWREPETRLDPVERLSFGRLRFEGDPSMPASAAELQEQACSLGEFATRLETIRYFGLIAPGDPRLNGDAVDLPCVQSIRTTRRVGPQGQIVFDLVAEITQKRMVQTSRGRAEFYGGSTVIINPSGAIRYIITKYVASEARLGNVRRFVSSPLGHRFWVPDEASGGVAPAPRLFALLHRVKDG
jgi:hypothetical protein